LFGNIAIFDVLEKSIHRCAVYHCERTKQITSQKPQISTAFKKKTLQQFNQYYDKRVHTACSIKKVTDSTRQYLGHTRHPSVVDTLHPSQQYLHQQESQYDIHDPHAAIKGKC